ncbi:MAG: universal stress protein, partial [Gemmatimonadota bacterium]|nr:universal stress protein [Gemmatimonadota bacterium]
MYTRILVPLEHSDYDDAIVAHVRELALLCQASVVFIHVADGWAARNQHQLVLRESDEMKQDREYIEARADGLEAAGLDVDCVLAGGDPAAEIAAAAMREG